MTIQWRKSSHSGGASDSACIELGRLARGVGVRDSKNPHGGHLTLNVDQLSQLVAEIKRDSLPR
ncbi:DUF397 domain-containing protein [Spirillospora sp. CA-253888]